jgi:hypothetical protein
MAGNAQRLGSDGQRRITAAEVGRKAASTTIKLA